MKKEGAIKVGDIFCQQKGTLETATNVYFVVERTVGEEGVEMSRFEYGCHAGWVEWKAAEVYKLEFVTNLWNLH